MVCKGNRPDGPFTPVNLNEEGTATTEGSILGFDPSIYVDLITDPSDPDYNIGFRAYGFWGFQRSLAAELDRDTWYPHVREQKSYLTSFRPAPPRELSATRKELHIRLSTRTRTRPTSTSSKHPRSARWAINM